jgi:protein tyrosine phosphatase (PTP) superfamily phosphohydrolase (DUF442 family)
MRATRVRSDSHQKKKLRRVATVLLLTSQIAYICKKKYLAAVNYPVAGHCREPNRITEIFGFKKILETTARGARQAQQKYEIHIQFG